GAAARGSLIAALAGLSVADGRAGIGSCPAATPARAAYGAGNKTDATSANASPGRQCFQNFSTEVTVKTPRMCPLLYRPCQRLDVMRAVVGTSIGGIQPAILTTRSNQAVILLTARAQFDATEAKRWTLSHGEIPVPASDETVLELDGT